MSAAEGTLAAAGLLASAGWLWTLIRAALHGRREAFLADLPPGEPAGGWPALAAVFAARDEAAEVEVATRSLLSQDYPSLRVVAVDDRSEDGTGEILERLAREDPRLTVRHVRELPSGWLGKTHALETGWRAADAEWVLFTDGDVVFSPGALRRAVRHAVQNRLDHLTVIPDVPVESAGEKLFLVTFGLLFLLRGAPWAVRNPRSRAHVGAGAFNLVRAAALGAAGGFRPIALSVDDDIRLGQMLKWTGGRARVIIGLGAVCVRWQAGLGGMIRGLEKNFYAVLGYRPLPAALGALAILWSCAAPHAGLLAGPAWSRAICGAGVGAIALLLHAAGPRRRAGAHYALLLPLGAAILAATLLRSVGATLRRGGVRWRRHLYPLPELRAHVRRREAWMRAAWARRSAGT